MSACRCMHHALSITRQPMEQWAEAIQRLPDTCTQDCAEPRSCRVRNADYLRVQYKALKRRNDIAAEKARRAGAP